MKRGKFEIKRKEKKRYKEKANQKVKFKNANEVRKGKLRQK